MQTAYTILIVLLFLIEGILACYLLIPFMLLLVHGVRKIFSKGFSARPVIFQKDFDFAAIITAHQDTRFIPPLIDSFLKQGYNNFIVYVVADDCDISSFAFNDPRVKILRPEESLHAKIRSIRYAVDRFERAHDVLVVFDSDNLVHPDYFQNLNEYFRRGFRAVQTHMLSKNNDSVFARLDSMGHVYNNFVERQAKMELGLSSSILGLGIAIQTDLYRQVMYKDNLGGFDKKLQADIIAAIPQLAFAEDAIVYDEKVEDGDALEKQRTRWIYTYFKYFPVNWSLFTKGLKKMNFNLSFFGFNALRPPLFITVGLAIIFCATGFFISPFVSLAWGIILILFILAFVLIVITQQRQKGTARALLFIPVIVLRQLKAFLKIKKAGREFLKTDHLKIIYIDELLKNEVR
jgi:cellulose synthase/poly-beta-1,6-N-acetylglucosamine synthase-like glycosyltransferase